MSSLEIEFSPASFNADDFTRRVQRVVVGMLRDPLSLPAEFRGYLPRLSEIDIQVQPSQVTGGAVTSTDTRAADEVLVTDGSMNTWQKLDMDNLTGGAAAAGEVLTAPSSTTLDWLLLSSTNFRQNSWTTYTPALTAVTTNPTLGTGSTAAGRWVRGADRTIHATVDLRFGTSGVAAGSGAYRVSLPVASGGPTIGAGYLYDSSTGAMYLLTTFAITSTTVCLVAETVEVVTDASPLVWAAQDQIQFSITYEGAS